MELREKWHRGVIFTVYKAVLSRQSDNSLTNSLKGRTEMERKRAG
jgi:hypothetical protein